MSDEMIGSAMVGTALFFGTLMAGRKIVGGIARPADIIAVLVGIVAGMILFNAMK